MQTTDHLPLVDSHCHLDRLAFDQIEGGLAGALRQAEAAGVGHFLCVAINLAAYPAMRALVEDFPQVSVSVGVHPTDGEGPDPGPDALARLAQDPRVVALGETGLDYYYDAEHKAHQQAQFRSHVQAARAVGKPLIVHTRDARADTLAVLREEGASAVGGVMHCFTEDWDTARQALDLGFYISFSGIVTFRNAEDLRAVARQVPADRVLVETDSPYLAPVPKRGKSNQPAYVRYVAEALAEVRGESFAELARQTTENYFRLFGRPPGQARSAPAAI
ncbi:MAG: TatD family hydrolase [Gammaproteobacteria bacterium]